MKTFSLLLMLFSVGYAFGQSKSSQPISVSAVHTLMNTSTVDDVKKRFGEASDELATPTTHMLVYKTKTDSSQYVFHFNQSGKLYSFAFDSQRKTTSNQLPYAKAKEARVLSTKAEIFQKLGAPTQVIMNTNKETWYYKFGDKQSGEKDIMIDYDLARSQVVKKYRFYANANKSVSFDSDIVASLKVGFSSLSEVEKRLGEPTKVSMGVDEEDWYYISDLSTLIVYFDKQSKVNNYLFTKKAKE